MRRLSLLSGGEKSLVALAFVFAVLLARPCPFYILDEVEAALDDLNLDRFLRVVRRFADRLAVHHRHPPEADDGRGRRPLRDQHGRRRHHQGRLAPLPRDEAAEHEAPEQRRRAGRRRSADAVRR